VTIKKVKGRDYAYCRRRDKNGRTKEIYLGPIEKDSESAGFCCQRCGKRLSDQTIRKSIISQLQKARTRMWNEKRHISDYAQYELLGILVEAFSNLEKSPQTIERPS